MIIPYILDFYTIILHNITIKQKETEMHYSYSFNLLGGLGVVGRFILALAALIIMKNFNKDDGEYSRGIRLLIFFGIVMLAVIRGLVLLWFTVFGAAVILPNFGHFYY